MSKRSLISAERQRPYGCTEATLRAHGFRIETLVDLVRAGLATAQAETCWSA